MLNESLRPVLLLRCLGDRAWKGGGGQCCMNLGTRVGNGANPEMKVFETRRIYSRFLEDVKHARMGLTSHFRNGDDAVEKLYNSKACNF